ncbi:hypothetical protein MRX96_019381 [Rhipicephalus microplus]
MADASHAQFSVSQATATFVDVCASSVCSPSCRFGRRHLDGGGDFLSLSAAAGGHATTERPSSSWRPLTLANSYNHREGDPVPEAEQGAVLTPGCLPSAMVCSKEISTRPGHPRSRAPNHRAVLESIAVLDSRVTKIEADQVKALQSAEATPAQVIPNVRIVQKVATRSVSQERDFEGPNNGGTP